MMSEAENVANTEPQAEQAALMETGAATSGPGGGAVIEANVSSATLEVVRIPSLRVLADRTR